MKRQESSSQSSSAAGPPSSSGSLLPSSAAIVDNTSEDAVDDHNGKDKYHGSVMDSFHRWTVRHGKSAVMASAALLLSVFFIPPAKMAWRAMSPPPTAGEAPPATAVRGGRVAPSAATTETERIIPDCPTAPWKPEENMQGKCPGDLKPYPAAGTLPDCASACCADPACVTWQYRKDVGCLRGGDVRLGQEKDGVAAWCSDHPPQRWNGQYVKPHGNKHGKVDDVDEFRRRACDEGSWDPEEEIGQCFGLGDLKKDASGSKEACMAACCADETCGAWQWNKELGCFYGKGMHSCQGNGNPIQFEPFVGRRKFMKSRSYTDKHNKPWQMAMR